MFNRHNYSYKYDNLNQQNILTSSKEFDQIVNHVRERNLDPDDVKT